MSANGLLFKTNTFVSTRYFDVISAPLRVRAILLHNDASSRARLIPEMATRIRERIVSNVSSFPKIGTGNPPPREYQHS